MYIVHVDDDRELQDITSHTYVAYQGGGIVLCIFWMFENGRIWLCQFRDLCMSDKQVDVNAMDALVEDDVDW